LETSIVPVPRELLLLDGMVKGLAEVRDIDTVKQMRDTAQRIVHWAQRRGYESSLVNMATEAKLRSERRLGLLLKEMPNAKTGPAPKVVSDASTQPPTLADVGISRDDSMNWQRIASIPKEAFEGRIAEVKDAGKILTTSTMLGLHRELNKPEPVRPDVFDFIREGKDIERWLTVRRNTWPAEHRTTFAEFVTQILLL
jgi:hypothetical protein